MLSLTLPPPLKVSPLIRFVRWTLLVSGIYYGITKDRYINKLSAKRREHMTPIIAERNLNRKIMSGEQVRIDTINMAADVGLTLPPEFYKPCYGLGCRDAYK